MVKRKLTEKDILSLPELYSCGLSSWAIAKKFNTCHSNILYHLKKQGLGRRSRSSAAKEGVRAGRIIIKKNYIPKNLGLNEDLAYILGVLSGDGYIDYSDKRRTYSMGLSAIDEEFVERFSETLSNFFKIRSSKEFKKSRREKWNNQYITRLCSKEACDFINSFGNFGKYVWRIPKLIKNFNNKIKCAFLKGFYDSEGDIDKKSRRINATSVNIGGLKEVSSLLKDIGIRNSIISGKSSKENCLIKHIVRIQDRKSIELFNQNIGFTIKRKQIILEESIRSYKLTKILAEDLDRLKPKIIELRKSGKNYTQIARTLNLNLSTIWNSLNVKEAVLFPRDRDRLTP